MSEASKALPRPASPSGRKSPKLYAPTPVRQPFLPTATRASSALAAVLPSPPTLALASEEKHSPRHSSSLVSPSTLSLSGRPKSPTAKFDLELTATPPPSASPSRTSSTSLNLPKTPPPSPLSSDSETESTSTHPSGYPIYLERKKH
ncbi:MAG: hypothetical protein WC860_00260 [Candidatus Margulisiibacteriota bacterium]|jgi:hypothetical protein